MRSALSMALFASLLLPISAARAAPIGPDSPTTAWLVVGYPLLDPDPALDEQTGRDESDIVGDATTAALYWQFDDAGTADMTDGNIGFRVRLADDSGPGGFDAFFMVGIDADFNGDIDLFIGVDNRGNPDEIAIFDPGTGGNTGPSNTSLITPAIQTYAPTSTNYDWSPVSNTIDPGVATLDFDGAGENDYFLTFVVPFADIVAALALQSIAFDDETAFQFVSATSNQANALNQDLGGIDGGVGDPGTWTALGGFSEPVAAALGPVPEPNPALLLAAGLVWLALMARVRTRH